MTLKPQSRAHGEGQGCQCREYKTGARLVRFFILIFFKLKVTLWKHRDLEAEKTQGFLPLVSGISKPDTCGATLPWGSPRWPMGLLAGGRGTDGGGGACKDPMSLVLTCFLLRQRSLTSTMQNLLPTCCYWGPLVFLPLDMMTASHGPGMESRWGPVARSSRTRSPASPSGGTGNS